MTATFGWAGKILRVDLSSGKIWTVDTLDYVPQFVGGMGIAAKIAWNELSPSVDALDPESPLFLMVGPLTGTLASGAGRVLVAGIAPQQRPPVFSRSGMGGHWGAELKYAGYDGIVVTGQAETPVYLWIQDDQVEIREAKDLWGQGTFATTSALRSRHGSKVRVVSIGQAGENLCRIACLQTETGNAAGQGGYGALMGSKKLKAVAVRGTGGVRVADPERLIDLVREGSREGLTPQLPRPGAPPSAQPSPQHAVRRRKCGFCLSACAHPMHMGVPIEDNPGTTTVAQQCYGFRSSPRGGLEARALASDLGLNGWEISYGIIPWLEMSKQHGLIDEIDGLPIPVPDTPIGYNRDVVPTSAEFLRMLLHKIAFREGELGDALADGACYAAYQLFDGRGVPLLDRIYPRHAGQTSHWNAHWGTGGNVYFPYWLVPVLQWCVDTRDPASDSTHSYTTHALRYIPQHGPEQGPVPWDKMREVSQRVYGNPDVFDSQFTYEQPETKALPAIYHHDQGMLAESLVLCEYEYPRVFSLLNDDYQADTAIMAKLLTACTGVETSEEELNRSGERIFNLLRAIDIRNHGRSRAVDWSAAESLTHPAFTEGECLDLERFSEMLDTYYRLRGWDLATGWPTRERLVTLGLADVADALDELAEA